MVLIIPGHMCSSQLSVRLEGKPDERGGRRAGLGEGQRPVGVQLARGAHSVDALPTSAATGVPPCTRGESGVCQHACKCVWKRKGVMCQ